MVGARHQRSACADELQRSTTEWAHAKLQIARALPSAAPAINCGWSVDGTVAANTKSYEYFIVLYFWHALELRKCRLRNRYPSDRRCGAGASGKQRRQRTNHVQFLRGTVVRLRPRGARLYPQGCSVDLADPFIVVRFASRHCPRIGRSTDFAVLTERLGAEPRRAH